MFVGRETELVTLDGSYKKGGFQFAVIYGRRRVGKTTLIDKFISGKKAVYFVATESTILVPFCAAGAKPYKRRARSDRLHGCV